jgi:hypothetical protein
MAFGVFSLFGGEGNWTGARNISLSRFNKIFEFKQISSSLTSLLGI